MLNCFLIYFTVLTGITTLAVSAASIPRPRSSRKSAGISIPLTKHSPPQDYNKGVNVDGLKSRAASYTTKILRGLENYERNTGKPYPFASKPNGSQNRKRDGAGLDLTSYNYNSWYAPIFVGTPPKLFTVQLDTGSSDLFIPASTGDVFCKTHDNLWNPALSETAQDLDKSFGLEFGDGADVEGQQYSDNITIAGFTADKQTIGVATTYSADMEKSNFPADGMLGLAFTFLSKYPALPLLETLVSEEKLPEGVFSLKLAYDGGEMYVGGVNEELYTGDITFVDVQAKAYWQVVVDDIRVDGKPVLTSVVSIIDTGANYIFGDPDRVSALYQAHGGKAFEDGWYSFPCEDFPDVILTFRGKPFTIPADVLNLGPVEDGSPDCFSGIVAHDPTNNLPFWSIGANFLQLFYTVFSIDRDPPQVGFAHLA